MARLQIYLLGNFCVTHDGQPVNLGYDKVRALLAYLAVENDRPIGREKLAGLLWPDFPQAAAQEGLRQAISRLRKAIGDRTATTPFLLSTHDSLQLNPQADCWVDVKAFRQTLADCAAHTHRHAVTCPACTRQRRTACDLYRGEFLENLSLPDSDLFEDWVRLQRQELNTRVLHELHQLATYYERQANPELVQKYANRQIAIDPLNEAAHRQLWRSLAAEGQSSLVVRLCQNLRQSLVDELGVAPSQETVLLVEQIRAGTLSESGSFVGTASSLPGPLSPLIGRSAELVELEAWLADPARRLITIIGPGGIGKTHLALTVADRHRADFEHGVVLISFGLANVGESYSSLIARALRMGLNVSEPLETQIERYLHDKDMLLLLDGFEHAWQARPLLLRWLEHAPRVVGLVTSRERLNLPGEWLFDLGGLECPPAGQSDDLEKYSAAVLFLNNARRINTAFRLADLDRVHIGQICRLTGGLPLALNLAAAWTRTLSPREVAAELGRGLDLLVDSYPSAGEERLSLRAVFDQSWEMLLPEDQSVFRQVSIFQGGFDKQAAFGVASASLEVLASLVDRSFLRVSAQERFDAHELLIQYGREKLQLAGETEATLQRHFNYFLEQAVDNDRAYHDGQMLNAILWIAKEYSNLQAALTWGEKRFPKKAERLKKAMHVDWHSYGVHLLAGVDT